MLLPLALCDDQLAEEREQQRLPLLAAQTGMHHLLWRRLALRAGAMVLPLLILHGTAARLPGGGASVVSLWSAWLAWTMPVLD